MEMKNLHILKKLFFLVAAIQLSVLVNAQVYTFTNAGATGINGPTQAQINTAYGSTNLAGQVTSVNGIQNWIVPAGGNYRIEVYGAEGFGTLAGRGAYMSGTFSLTSNDTLKILVGQQGGCCVGSGTNQFGGGGGSFVVTGNNTPLIIAGGGGGAIYNTAILPSSHGSTGLNGQTAVGTTSGTGGTSGNGGIEGGGGGGGGGFFTDGTIQPWGGKSFLNGGQGGETTGSGGRGGFGGGAGCNSFNNGRGGGGGGYSGGGGAGSSTTAQQVGGGGGSFNIGSNQVNTAGVRTGHGMVVITLLTPPVPNDAGVASIVPLGNFCAGLQNIQATIQNFGTNPIDSVNVSWSVNNVFQATITHNTTLDTSNGLGASSALINLGNFNFTQSIPYIIKIWTSMPNGVVDTVNFNDTLSVTVRPSLAGIYTINTAQITGGTNFQNLTDAINALTNFGVCGPVILDVDSNLFGSVTIPAVSGMDSINTLTIKGNGYTITSTTSPVIAFSQARFVTLDSLNVTLNATTGFGIHLGNQSRNITIRNSTINVGTTSTLTSNGGIVASGSQTVITTTGANANNVTIENNTIIGGYYGVSLVGTGTYLGSSGHIIRNNTFLDNYFGGVYLSSTDTVLVENNNISRATRATISTYYGIYGTTTRNTKVIRNRIHSTGAGSYTCYPIWFATSINSVGFETEIINNAMWNFPTTSVLHGIHLTISTTGFRIYHNTISLNLATGSSGTVRGINFGVAANATDFRNNIISIAGNGTGVKSAIHLTAASPTLTSNRNVLHMAATGGTNNVGFLTTNQTTLANWQTASSQDANSSSLDPVFTNLPTGNLIPVSANIDNLGSPVGVLTDLLGVTRSITTPDVGAYEFTGISGDMSISDARLARVSQCYGTTDSVYLTVNNLIGSTVDFIVDPLTVVYEVTGPVVTVDSIVIFSGALAVGNSLTVFANNIDMSVPGNYTLRAYIRPNAVNVSALNDTFTLASQTEVKPILSVTPRTGLAVSPTDTFVIEARSPLFPAGGVKFTEICHWRGATGAAPVGGWPAYLIADDYVELIGLPNSDIAGYTLEVWTATALQHSVTFPSGTVFSPWGTMIIATGQLTGSVPSPANFYYHSGNTTSYGSTTAQGYIIKNPVGDIVDAVTYGAITFPAAAGVTAANWTGSTPSASSAGNRLIGPDVNTGTNWITENASNRQDPNIFNAGVPAIVPGSMAGFNWTYLGGPLDTNAKIVVGPYTVPGIYQYVATYTNACGTFFDTVTITAASTVPVTLSKLEAIKRASNVVVQWSTASEINNSHFVVERSIDGVNFEGIGRVRGNGTTNRSMQYSYTDAGVLDQYSRVNTIYYRLRQVDFDGSEELSRVVRVQNNQDQGARAEVLPNPNRGSFVLELSTDWENEATVTIYNMTGSAVYSKETMLSNGTNRMEMNLDLPSGVYSVVVNHQGIQTIKRFVIE
jgi:parallel beta-helix repeat protein